jgi:phage major head subunit gpT-like protein
MLITKAVLQALQTSVSTIFRSAYRDTPTPILQLATRVTSNHKVETYGWMQRLLEMREWIGPRVIQGMATQAYTLENKKFESTLAVDVDEIADDSLGLFAPRAEEFGRVGARLWEKLTIDALVNGNAATSLGFDGLPFFSANHPLNPAAPGGVQSNNITVATPLNSANLDVMRTAMQLFTGEDGRFLGVYPTHIVIPTALEMTAKGILNAQLTTNGGTNVFNGLLGTIVIPELPATAAPGATSTWYLVDLSAPIKPLLLQVRKPVTLVSKVSLTDDNVFWQQTLVWGLDARGVVGYGPWWLAMRIQGV